VPGPTKVITRTKTVEVPGPTQYVEKRVDVPVPVPGPTQYVEKRVDVPVPVPGPTQYVEKRVDVPVPVPTPVIVSGHSMRTQLCRAGTTASIGWAILICSLHAYLDDINVFQVFSSLLHLSP
jgi:hypothetical protein